MHCVLWILLHYTIIPKVFKHPNVYNEVEMEQNRFALDELGVVPKFKDPWLKQ